MRKYWAFYKAGLTRMSIYRGPLVIWTICSLLSLSTMLAVWFSSKADGQIATYSKDQLITYAILGVLMAGLVNWNPFTGVRDRIKDGSIAGKILLKPVSMFFERMMWELSWKTVAILFNLSVTLIAALLLKNNLVLPHPSMVYLLLLVVSMIGASLIQFCFALCLGLLTFWFTETQAIASMRWIGMAILGGASIPIAFIPQALQLIVSILPFRYMFSLPMEILLGKIDFSEAIGSLLIQLCWLMIFIFIYRFLWREGLKHYVSVGQ